MSTHIAAKEGQIAESVLLPGDPLRAKFIAENILQDAVCYSQIRGMYGYTGTYNGKRVSVQGTGMGQPSLSIYVNELFQFYGVQKAVRIGTCGGMVDGQKIGDVVIAQSACTDSAIVNRRFGYLHYAPTSDFSLLLKAYNAACKNGISAKVGPVYSSDVFYDKEESWRLMAEYGCIGCEMETAELLMLAAKFHRQGLAIMTVSDIMATGEGATPEQRQTSFTSMMKIALEAVTTD